MRPRVLDLQLDAAIILTQRQQLQTGNEAVRNASVQLNCNFSAAALGLDHARQRDELPDSLRFSYSRISSSKRFWARTPAAATNERIARTTRPDLPITLPISRSATLSSNT